MHAHGLLIGCSYHCRSCCSDPQPRAMALRLLSRSAVRARQPGLSPQVAVNVLQRSAQRPRQVAASSKDSGVLADLDSIPSTSSDGNQQAAAATMELPIQRFIWPKLQSKFCRMCGAQMDIIQPDGDKEWRHVCKGCGYIGRIDRPRGSFTSEQTGLAMNDAPVRLDVCQASSQTCPQTTVGRHHSLIY